MKPRIGGDRVIPISKKSPNEYYSKLLFSVAWEEAYRLLSGGPISMDVPRRISYAYTVITTQVTVTTIKRGTEIGATF